MSEDVSNVTVSVEKSPSFRTINSSGVAGSIRPGGLVMNIYYEQQDLTNVLINPYLIKQGNEVKIIRTIECEIVMDATQMVTVYEWLGQKIKEYQEKVGPIPFVVKVDDENPKDESKESPK